VYVFGMVSTGIAISGIIIGAFALTRKGSSGSSDNTQEEMKCLVSERRDI
jgi:hypothetical protein